MYLLDHGEMEELILFVWNFQKTLSATVTLEMEANVQYFCTLIRGEALRKFDLVSADTKNIETLLDIDYQLKG